MKMPVKRPILVLSGNPGTGKTAIAEIVADVLAMVGLTDNNSLISTQREDLVGSHIGETAQKTEAVIDSARGGTLLVDEVYRLVPADSPRDYGKEALDTIMSAIEGGPHTITDRPAIIFAGYPELMNGVLAANPGLSRRITTRFNFPDYTIPELVDILFIMVKKDGFKLAESCTRDILADQISNNTTTHLLSRYNAGFSSLVYTEAKQASSMRIADTIVDRNYTPTPDYLRTFVLLDFTEGIISVMDSISEN